MSLYCKANGYAIWLCHTGFLTVWPLPTSEQIERYYSNQYFQRDPGRYHAVPGSVHWEVAARGWHGRIGRILAVGGSLSVKGWNCLDIGAGTGMFAHLLHEAGARINCVEFTDEGRDSIVRLVGSETTIWKGMDQCDSAPEAYDLITMWAFLEHIPYDKNFLKRIAAMLKPGGVVALSSPNANALNRRLFKAKWRYFCPPEHVAFYHPALLTELARREGLTTAYSRTLFSGRAFLEGIGLGDLKRGVHKIMKGLGLLYDWCGWGDNFEIYLIKRRSR